MRFLSAASVLLYATLSVASNVVDLTPKNFDDIVLKSGKPALVKFFAPWCGHCKKLAPTYDELGDAFASLKDKVTIAKVDADAHKALGKRFGIKGFPTLKWFDGKSEEPIAYDSARTLDALTKFVQEKTNLKPKGSKKAPVSDVKVLTDSNFEAIAKDPKKGVFVKFYAPWCGHCKNLAPIYEKVATDFSRDSNVVVAKIDCDAPNGKQTSEKYGIQGFPTLKFFPADPSAGPIDYDGPRSEEGLLEFINEHSGLHRVPGGGLNEKAGTIELLDELIKEKLPNGLAGIAADLEDAVKLVESKYGQYYVKVAKKLEEKADYAKKELERLKKMIEKGGLKPDKFDDITQRANILKRFQGSEEAKPSGKDEL
ncbi:Thioredoxin [Dactylella cylindrospora]|nr:Thioredoxin [Dactylella cylindrospora]